MMESMRARAILVFVFLVFCLIYLLPNFVQLPEGYWLHKSKLSYGLDIQGGAHLVYGVDVQGVMHERVERLARGLAEELKEKNLVAEVKPDERKESLIINASSTEMASKVAAHLDERYGADLQTETDGNTIRAKYFDAVILQYKENVINQAIEVIRNRIDEFGVAEPVIAAQGKDRILIQLPGITDSARAKDLINRTARLVFRLVDGSKTSPQLNEIVSEFEKAEKITLGQEGVAYSQYVRRLNESVKDKLPPNTMIAFQKAENATTMEAGRIPYLLTTDQIVTGDLLEDAFMSFGEFGEPTVSFRFGSEGRRKFGELTGNNVNRLLAIVLDDVVYSAPNITERIEGQGQITLGSRNFEESQKEGQLIATALRAGALPAALQQLEERTVGPSLGADSIQKGKSAGMIGVALVIAFMTVYYKKSGAIASLTLMLNVAGLLAILSALGATLTLPGIAGIILTVGMAVDANVIIFERIREELQRGSVAHVAVTEGFKNAWSAIFDSNVTTAIAATVLIYFGSGPVRGFGVTLIAGIFTTIITAVFVSHYLMDLAVSMSRKKSLSI